MRASRRAGRVARAGRAPRSTQPPRAAPARWALWPGLAAVLLGLLVYAPAFRGELVWDDQTTYGQQVQAFHSLREVLQPPAGIAYWTYAYYRPLVTLSYLLDLRLFGPGAATGPHVISVACFLVTVSLVWLLARRLLAGRPGADAGALVAAALFAVHPIHTESVSWITGRSDVLATLFLLGSVHLALRWRDRGNLPALLLAPGAFLAAMLAKENGATALALVPLVFLLAPAPPSPPGPRRAAGLAAAFAVAAAIYLALRTFGGVTAVGIQEHGPGEFIPRLLGATAWYLGKLVVPWPQSNIPTFAMVPGVAEASLVLLVALAATALAARHWQRSGDGVPLLATGWIWITLTVPMWSAVGAESRTLLAERQLFLPSVGLALLLGAGWCAAVARGWRRPAAVAAALLIAAGAGATVARGLVWQDDLALWTDATRSGTGNALAFFNLGTARVRAGQDAAAGEAFARALPLATDDDIRFQCNLFLGFTELHRNDLAAAVENFRAAVALRPDAPEPWYGLGTTYGRQAGLLGGSAPAGPDLDLAGQAVVQLRGALFRKSGYIPARLALAALLADMGDALAAAGDRDAAAGRYREAGRELAALWARIPPAKQAEAAATLQKETGINATALARRLQP